MWPNDADGNAIRGGARSAAQEGRLHDRRPRRLRGRHNRLHRADLAFQEQELRDLQHVPDPAGLRHVLGAGGAAGIQAEDRADRQDRAVPVSGRGARLDRQRARERRLLGSDLAVLLVAHRHHLRESGERVRGELRQGVEPAGRREPRALRCRRSRAQGERQSQGQAGGRDGDEERGGRHPARSSRVGNRAESQRRRDTDHRRTVGCDSRNRLSDQLRDLRELERSPTSLWPRN